MKKKDRRELKAIILTAIATAILTSAGSYFLMYSQLSYEQDYWKERTRTEQVLALLEKQTLLMNEINEGIMINETLVKNYKLHSAKFMSDMSLAYHSGESIPADDSFSIESRALELHQQIDRLAAKIQESELYFSAEVDSLLNPLSQALQANYNTNQVLIGELDYKDVESIKLYFQRDFETISELRDKRYAIYQAMRDEVGRVTSVIYEGQLGEN
jgi:hypothetical protein